MSEALEFALTLYPSPILRRTATPVTDFDAGLERTVAAMLELMFTSKGVGLAAPQVGLDRRILVYNPEGDPEQPEANRILINPVIVSRDGDKSLYEEGCLSFPGIYAEIERPDRCTVEAYDIKGNRFEQEFSGFESRVVQHEYDHLEGILLVDRMSPADKLKNRAALAELVERYKSTRS